MHPILEQFQKDIANHSLEVRHDDGIYRHLTFTNNGSIAYRFDLVTWPGYLCISGDMGCFTFSRLPDMFEFFRDDNGSMGINPGYWAEKLQAGAGAESDSICKEWSEEKFREVIRERYDEHVDADGKAIPGDEAKDLWEEIEDRVLANADLEDAAMRSAMDFNHEGFEFTDFFEVRCTTWRFHYLWCCLAIVHGIAEYDKLKAEVAA